MRRILIGLICMLAITAATPVVAAIQYGGDTYAAPFAASTTEQVGGLVSGVDLNNLTSPSSISAGLGIWGNIRNFFINVDSWFKEKAGIDFFGILKTIGHWFALTLEWILKGLKLLL